MSEPVLNETPAPRKKMSVWKLIGVIAASIAGALVLIYVWLAVVGNRRFGEMEKVLVERTAEATARDASRPVLRGTAVPGNGWTDYALALAEVEKLKAERSALGEFAGRGPKADRAKVEGILAAHPEVLERLRQGAARATGQYPYVWEDGFSGKSPGLLSSQTMGNMAVARSRFLSDEGKAREAAELLLDCCQFARDLGHNASLISEMISSAIYALALDDLRDLVLGGKLSREDLLEVDRELAILDASYPSHAVSLANEVVGAGWGLRRGGEEGTGMEGVFMLGKFGGPGRLLVADAFDTYGYFLRRAGSADAKPWAESMRIQSELEAEVQKLWNPISKIMIPGLLSSCRVGRERRSQIRLLRVAARFRATGEVADLDDPFGTKLVVSRTGDHLKVWSVNRDGVDDGGAGAWKPQAGRDIVLEADK